MVKQTKKKMNLLKLLVMMELKANQKKAKYTETGWTEQALLERGIMDACEQLRFIIQEEEYDGMMDYFWSLLDKPAKEEYRKITKEDRR